MKRISTEYTRDFRELINQMTDDELGLFLNNSLDKSGKEHLSVKMSLLPGNVRSYMLVFEDLDLLK